MAEFADQWQHGPVVLNVDEKGYARISPAVQAQLDRIERLLTNIPYLLAGMPPPVAVEPSPKAVAPTDTT